MSFIGQNDLFLLRVGHLKFLDEFTVLCRDHLTPAREFINTLPFFSIMLLEYVYQQLKLFIVYIFDYKTTARATVGWPIKSDGLFLINHETFKTFPLSLEHDIQHA